MLKEDRERSIIYAYNCALMTNSNKKLNVLFESGKNPQEAFAVIWRYAITYVLEWNPEDAVVNLNAEILKKLKLQKTLDYVHIYYDPRRYFDMRQPLSIAFPDTIHFSTAEEVEEVYDHVMHIGKYCANKSHYNFPKGFYTGDQGLIRLKATLRHQIAIYFSDMNIVELYAFFGNTSKAKRWFASKGLWNHIKTYYKLPLEYFHNSLPLERRNELLYQNEMVKQAIRKC